MSKLAKQFKKPTGFLGRIAVKIMNSVNKKNYHKIVSDLQICDGDRILEIGFGNGVMIHLMGESNGKCQIVGIDFSELMYKFANKKNRKLIENKRLQLYLGDFLEFKFEAQKFTKICCVNIIYFWSDPLIVFKKIYEMLESRGIFAMNMVKAEELAKNKVSGTDIYKKYSESQITKWLKESGFDEVVQSNGTSAMGAELYFFAKKK